jgi:hypothetical protein
VLYAPGQEEAARTVAYAAGATMVSDSSAWGIRLEIGDDFEGINSSIVLAKRKSSTGTDGTGTDPEADGVTKADEEVCAG